MPEHSKNIEPLNVREHLTIRNLIVEHVERIYSGRRVRIVEKESFNIVLMHIIDELPGNIEDSWLAVPVNASNQPSIRPVVRLYPHHILEVLNIKAGNTPSKKEYIRGSKN